MDLIDFMQTYKTLEIVLDNNNLIIISGETGTGKTFFIKKYLKKLEQTNVVFVDSSTPLEMVLNFFKFKSFFHKYTIVVYDDEKITQKILTEVSNIVARKNINNKFIVIVNKLAKFTKSFKVKIINHPTKTEVMKYINHLGNVSTELRKEIIRMPRMDIRRIMFTLEDGFYSGLESTEERFHITKAGNFILSLGVAENLSRLRKLNKEIIEADKLKFVNDYFYLNYLKCIYPTIERMKLRYPKNLLELTKKRK